MQRTLLALGALVLAAIAAALLLWTPAVESGAHASTPAVEVASEPEPPAAELAPAESGAGTVESAVEREEVRAAESFDESGPAAAFADARRVEFEVVVSLHDGESVTGLDGTLAATVEFRGDSRREVTLAVVRGRATLELDHDDPEPDAIRVESATLGEIEADADRLWFDLDPPDVVVLRAHELQTISARDAVTGAPVSPLWVARASNREVYRRQHPGIVPADAALAGPASAPVSVRLGPAPTHRGVVPVFVRAQGYAWNRVDFETHRPTRLVVDLEPGGSLEASVSGVGVEPDLWLRVRTTAGELLCDAAVSSDALMRIEGLPVGAWVASVERGPGQHRAELARAEFQVEPAEVARVALTPEFAVTELHTVPVTILVPSAWESESITVLLETLQTENGSDIERRLELEPVAESGGVRRYETTFAELPPAFYGARVEPFGALFVMTVPGAGFERWEVSEPWEVSVRAVDLVTGEDTPLAYALWVSSDGPGGEPRHLDVVPGESSVRFSTAARGLMLVARSTSGETLTENVELAQPLTEVLLVFGRMCRLRVRFESDGAPCAPPLGWALQPVPVEGSGKRTLTSSSSDYVEVHLDQPGTYRFEGPELEGYEPVPMQTVVLVGGELTEHVVRLERSR